MGGRRRGECHLLCAESLTPRASDARPRECPVRPSVRSPPLIRGAGREARARTFRVLGWGKGREVLRLLSYFVRWRRADIRFESISRGIWCQQPCLGTCRVSQECHDIDNRRTELLVAYSRLGLVLGGYPGYFPVKKKSSNCSAPHAQAADAGQGARVPGRAAACCCCARGQLRAMRAPVRALVAAACLAGAVGAAAASTAGGASGRAPTRLLSTRVRLQLHRTIGPQRARV